ncbi:MAG: DUF4838 domain-containing protein [Kiritimatiellae bacterium]|nr:DUF4838 domain-containing protein [Kiritimatiellia bacterium]
MKGSRLMLIRAAAVASALATSLAPGGFADAEKPVAAVGTPAPGDTAKSASESPGHLVTFLYRVAAPEAWRVESHRWLDPSAYGQYAAVVLTGGLQPDQSGLGHWNADAVRGPLSAYVRAGGVIAIEGPALGVLAGGQGLDRALAELAGFGSVQTAPADTARVAGRDTLLAWGVPGALAAGHLAGARMLAAWVDRASGRDLGAAVTVRELGAGKVFFFGVPLAGLYEAAARAGAGVADGEGEWHASEQEQGADACRELWIKAIGAAGPARDAARQATTWGTQPLGKPAAGGPRQPPPHTPPEDYEKLSTVLEQPDPRALAGANPVTLVEEGQVRAALVLRAEAPAAERRLADLIARHIHEMSGAKLPVLDASALGRFEITAQGARASEPRWRESAFVLLGGHEGLETIGVNTATLGPEGMAVRTVGNAVAVCGKDEPGLQHASVDLLERLGCRYLWPGSLGHVVPRRKTVVVPATNVAETPQLITRNIRMFVGWGDKENFMPAIGLDEKTVTDALRKEAAGAPFATAKDKTAGWAAWQRLGGRKISRGHAYGTYWHRFGKEHPEWFALQPNGSRDQSGAKGGDRPRLCHSNEELIRQIVRDRLGALQKHPNGSVSLSLNDGGGTTFCLCEACRRLDSPHAEPIALPNPGQRVRLPYVSLTDRVLTFSNRIMEELAATHPEALAGVYAYSVYKHPPVHVRPHPNLTIWYVGQGWEALHHWNEWRQYADRLFYRPNFRGGEYGYPANFARRTLADTKYLYNRGLAGTDYDGTGMHWSQRGFVLYLLARAQWNPNRLDYEELLDDYCSAGFGPAAEPVRQYIALLEPLTERRPHAQKWTASDFEELKRLLDAARELAAKAEDPKVPRRVAFLRRGLDIGERLWLYQRGGSAANAAALKEAIARAVLEEPYAVFGGQMTRTLRWPNQLAKRK